MNIKNLEKEFDEEFTFNGARWSFNVAVDTQSAQIDKVKSFYRKKIEELENEYLNKLQDLSNQKYEGAKQQERSKIKEMLEGLKMGCNDRYCNTTTENEINSEIDKLIKDLD